MRHPRSIIFHLSVVFIFFFLLIIFLGMLSITRLRDFNGVSADIADVWLPNTRVLGDLNNYTSDFRAAEGNNLLAPGAERGAIEREIVDLDRAISLAQASYERIPHDNEERELYSGFRERWNAYRAVVNQMLELSRGGRKVEAVATYMTTSRQSYNAASDALGQLTRHAVARAQTAAARVAVAYQEARWLIVMAMMVAAVLVVGALIYIRRSVSTPLMRLAGYMHRLAANDTDIEIAGTERKDEIGEMARAAVVFRNNAIELMVTQRGLAQQASMLEEKLAAERHLTQLQRNFVSMASHEFRTPLMIIDGHAQRLNKLRERIGVEEITTRAGKMRAAVLRMTHLIDNLLTSTRLLESGAGLYFHPEEIDLRDVVRDVCQLHRESSPSSLIVEDLGAVPMRMVGAPKLLSQVFDNLLSNGIKYSPGGGSVRISVQASDDGFAVAVEDRGIGIPAADLSRLFERYFRGSNVSGIVGTGVGLNLVEMVVDLHGGSVDVVSEEGRGSCFTVRLPLRPPEDAGRTEALPPQSRHPAGNALPDGAAERVASQA